LTGSVVNFWMVNLKGINMNAPLEIKFTQPLSFAEEEALRAANKPVPPDWADSTTRASIAVRRLEDALPAGDKKKSVEALIALEKAVADIRSFMHYRKAV
jgi:hypothetical protein